MAILVADGKGEDTVPQRSDYIDRAEALSLLGVKPQTLYSYVSRGLVRRIPGPDERRSLYNCEDVMRLRARSVARSGHGPAAASAMQWGEPVMATAITEITVDGPRYRDQLATRLASSDQTFEGVAEYLWSGQTLRRQTTWVTSLPLAMLAAQLGHVFRLSPELHIRQLLTEAVTVLGWADQASSPTGARQAERLLHAMLGSFGYLGPARDFLELEHGESVAHGLARALGVVPTETNVRALNAALILLADHETTSATFAARIAASVGSDLYSCVGAALQVHFGSRLALRCDRVEQTLGVRSQLIYDPEADEQQLWSTPTSLGFVHPLYADGDPRVAMLRELTALIRCRGGWTRPAPDGKAENLRANLTLDEALVLFCRALGVARHVGSGLMALARAAGWVAHVLEQREQGFLIRPRAKFSSGADPAPEAAASLAE